MCSSASEEPPLAVTATVLPASTTVLTSASLENRVACALEPYPEASIVMLPMLPWADSKSRLASEEAPLAVTAIAPPVSVPIGPAASLEELKPSIDASELVPAAWTTIWPTLTFPSDPSLLRLRLVWASTPSVVTFREAMLPTIFDRFSSTCEKSAAASTSRTRSVTLTVPPPPLISAYASPSTPAVTLTEARLPVTLFTYNSASAEPLAATLTWLPLRLASLAPTEETCAIASEDAPEALTVISPMVPATFARRRWASTLAPLAVTSIGAALRVSRAPSGTKFPLASDEAPAACTVMLPAVKWCSSCACATSDDPEVWTVSAEKSAFGSDTAPSAYVSRTCSALAARSLSAAIVKLVPVPGANVNPPSVLYSKPVASACRLTLTVASALASNVTANGKALVSVTAIATLCPTVFVPSLAWTVML